MVQKPPPISLLPGEQVLHTQRLPWSAAEFNIEFVLSLSAGMVMLLLLPVFVGGFLAPDWLWILWLKVLGVSLAVAFVCYVWRSRRCRRWVMVTTERVLCICRKGRECECRVFSLRRLRVDTIGCKIWFRSEGENHVPPIDVGDAVSSLVKCVLRAQKDVPARAPVTPAGVGHPLLPEGEVLYVSGRCRYPVNVCALCCLLLMVAYYLSVAVEGVLNPPEEWPIWLSWGAQLVLVLRMAADVLWPAEPESKCFAIGTKGIYDGYGCSGLPDMSLPYTMTLHANGTVSFSLQTTEHLRCRIYLWHVAEPADIESLLHRLFQHPDNINHENINHENT